MLHILPGKSQEQRDDNPEEISYKKKKELQQKAQASRYALVHVQDCSTQCPLLTLINVFQTKHVFSSHNWNTLFLGANVVADVMSEKYNTDKTKILESVSNCVHCSRMCSGCCCADKHLSVFTVFQSSKESLGVRMALGETQIVMETREFLVKNGVILDMFSKVCISMCQLSGLCLHTVSMFRFLLQPAAARSKTEILVKNLPAGTTSDEITEMFAKFGTLGRVILPPSGVTGIVEFIEPTEARTAFRSLAYSRVQYLVYRSASRIKFTVFSFSENFLLFLSF